MDSTSASLPAAATAPAEQTVEAGRLPPWHVGQLPEPPHPGWRLWIGLIGPGVVLAGTSIGSGEWLFGPTVTAQYGTTFLWLASLSIILQVFVNLMMMRFTLYCGEPIIAGGMRTWPGPLGWILIYAAARFVRRHLGLQRLGGGRAVGRGDSGAFAGRGQRVAVGPHRQRGFFRAALGADDFRAGFRAADFWRHDLSHAREGDVAEADFHLGWLVFVTVFLVPPRVMWEVATGFVGFGSYAQRAETIIVDPHFHFTMIDNADRLLVKGTMENGNVIIGQYQINGTVQAPPEKLSPAEKERLDLIVAKAVAQLRPGSFFVETQPGKGDDPTTVLSVSGRVDGSQWIPEKYSFADADGVHRFDDLKDVPPKYATRLEELVTSRGLEKRSLVKYVIDHHELPDIDWFMLAAFTAIAGAGGLSNSMFSNYTREKGWGMGAHVGAIPSAIGGRTISLSHVGRVFLVDRDSLRRWHGWLRHVFRDQVFVWMLASFIGMALPCMVSLEFIRNATVSDTRVAAMTAEGISLRYPDHARMLWTMTLLCGFLVLAPGQISVGDQISRRWTDIIWMSNPRAQRMSGTKVKYVYYSILATYAVFGFTVLCLFPTLSIAKYGAGIGNIALGISCLQALSANRCLMPKALQPHWLLQGGVVCCALFFFGISGVVLYHLLR